MRKARWGRYALLWLSGVVFALLLTVTVLLFERLEHGIEIRQAEQLQEALRRAAVTCYAVEGRYPPTLVYLCARYGVQVDASQYIVRYDVLVENQMPLIDVIWLEGTVG